MTRLFLASVMLLSLTVAVPASALGQEKPRIAMLAPLSGADAALGRRMVRAAQFAIGPRADVTLEVFDSSEDPAAALAEAEASGAVAVLGPLMPWRIDAVRAVRTEHSPPLYLLSSV